MTTNTKFRKYRLYRTQSGEKLIGTANNLIEARKMACALMPTKREWYVYIFRNGKNIGKLKYDKINYLWFPNYANYKWAVYLISPNTGRAR